MAQTVVAATSVSGIKACGSISSTNSANRIESKVANAAMLKRKKIMNKMAVHNNRYGKANVTPMLEIISALLV